VPWVDGAPEPHDEIRKCVSRCASGRCRVGGSSGAVVMGTVPPPLVVEVFPRAYYMYEIVIFFYNVCVYVYILIEVYWIFSVFFFFFFFCHS
jgi:hypothetical protein